MAKKAAGCDLKLEYKHIGEVISLIEKNTGAAVDLPLNVRVRNEYGWLIFENTKETEVKGEEKTEISNLYMRVYPLESYYIEALSADIVLKLVEPKLYKKNMNEQLLDFDKLEGKKLILRNREQGDKIVCFEDGREKKLKNIFIDYKIPKEARDKIPLLCVIDGEKEEVAAIVGIRVSEKYKVTKETGRSLAIEYRKCKNND